MFCARLLVDLEVPAWHRRTDGLPSSPSDSSFDELVLDAMLTLGLKFR